MRSRFYELVSKQSGATAVEYGLMIVFIAIVIVAAVTTLGVSVTGIFTQMAGAF